MANFTREAYFTNPARDLFRFVVSLGATLCVGFATLLPLQPPPTITKNRPQGSVRRKMGIAMRDNIFYIRSASILSLTHFFALRKIPQELSSHFSALRRRYAAQRRLRHAVAVAASPTITKNRPQVSEWNVKSIWCEVNRKLGIRLWRRYPLATPEE